MKAVIPVAGAGTNLRPHTYTQPKPLIPVAGKPIIAFIIDQLIELGIEDFVFIIGYLGEKIKRYVNAQYPQIHSEWVKQEQRLGLGHAIWVAREQIRQADEIIIILGDTIVDVDFDELMGRQESCVGVKKVKDPREFGVVELAETGNVLRAIEKPNIPKSNLAMVGLYKIREVQLLLDNLDEHILSEKKTHGEYQLTDAIMAMIDSGVKFSTIEVNNWFDCGKKDILLETNATLLSRKGFVKSPEEEYESTIVIPPVSIGENCKILNSIIGPHVTIGENAHISYSIIKDSIIGSFTTIEEVVLHHSVVGDDAAIKGLRQSLNLGDNTQIDFG